LTTKPGPTPAGRLTFFKMHGAGNDFVVIDGVRNAIALDEAAIRHLADRRRGVGCDQVLLMLPATEAEADFRYRIFNADGGEVEQCGNGVRCVARLLADLGHTDALRLRLQSLGGIVDVELLADGRVAVNMGAPRLEPAGIPFRAEQRATRYPLDVADRVIEIGALSMGNPHAVLETDNVAEAPVATLGPAIENHPRFPRRANVGFLEITSPGDVSLRVHERGVGETLACGTGACAAVVWGRLAGRLEETVTVHLPGGDLVISWKGDGAPVWMTGPAVTVFEGRITL
jgi:diaminopimelate epimerase